MDTSLGPPVKPKKGLIQQGYMEDKSRTATTPKRGLVSEVCREWLVLEDGALAHQLQDQEIAAHYGQNRDRNRIVREDTPTARKEQEVELQQALAVQQLQQQLRDQQERADAEAAQKLAEELEKEEMLQRQVRAIRDEQLARRLQNSATKPRKKIFAEVEPVSETLELPLDQAEPIDTSMRSMTLNEPMSEEEARQWQELCDAELARKLQQEEEEESKWRRDVTDLSTKLAIEAQDRELAQALQEKEKARLRKAKEKSRLKAIQKSALQKEEESTGPHYQQLLSQPTKQQQPYDYHQYGGHPMESTREVAPRFTDNIAASIDPTWNRRQQSTHPHPQPQPIYQALHHQHQSQVQEQPRTLPITDLDFPAPVQSIVPGQRRTGPIGALSQPDSPEPLVNSSQSSRSKAGSSCSHQ